MNRAPAPVPSIEETSLNRLWAAPKLPRLSLNQLAVSGCTVAVPPFDQLGRLSDWSPGRDGESPPGRDRRSQPPRRTLRGAGSPDGLRRCAPRRPRSPRLLTWLPGSIRRGGTDTSVLPTRHTRDKRR